MIGDIAVITVHDIYRLFTVSLRSLMTSEDSDIDESFQAQDRLVNTDW
jgi:hypothetical protein